MIFTGFPNLSESIKINKEKIIGTALITAVLLASCGDNIQKEEIQNTKSLVIENKHNIDPYDPNLSDYHIYKLSGPENQNFLFIVGIYNSYTESFPMSEEKLSRSIKSYPICRFQIEYMDNKQITETIQSIDFLDQTFNFYDNNKNVVHGYFEFVRENSNKYKFKIHDIFAYDPKSQNKIELHDNEGNIIEQEIFLDEPLYKYKISEY